MTPRHRRRGYRPPVETLVGRYGVSALTAAFAVGALVEDLVNPQVRLGLRFYDRGPDVVIAVVLAGVVALVVSRHRLGIGAPLTAVALFGLASIPAPAWVLDSIFVFMLAMLVCGLVGYLTHARREWAGVLVLWATGILCAWRNPHPSWGQLGSVLTFMSVAWVAGMLFRGPVVRARSAEERAEHLVHEQAEAARQAVIDERQRIARELHDIIAHSVSVMTLQAGAVRRRLTPDQARERDSLLAVERTGRDALVEMRRLVGMLHEDDGVPSYAPQPGMRALDTLIGSVREAGLPVELAVEGARRDLPPGVDLAAYRVVQEALTNTLKHAGPARAWVQIRWSPQELRIEVANDGDAVGTAAGYGHVGMRERMRLYGGRLESGPRVDGGYVVRAYVPIGTVR